MLVFINGKWFLREEAKVSIFNRGFLYGEGLFETLRAYQEKIFTLDLHLERLFNGAKLLKIPIPYTKTKLKEILKDCLIKNNLKNAYLRLTISKGEGEWGTTANKQSELIIFAKEFNGYPKAFYQNGISVIISQFKITPLPFKSLSFLNNILAKTEAQNQKSQEALLLTPEGTITEGAVSNFFAVKGKTLYTPPLSLEILPGITRNIVIKIAKKLKIKVKEKKMKVKALKEFEEIFLTNTLYEIVPVFEIKGIKKYKINGEIISLLQKNYQALLDNL